MRFVSLPVCLCSRSTRPSAFFIGLKELEPQLCGELDAKVIVAESGSNETRSLRTADYREAGIYSGLGHNMLAMGTDVRIVCDLFRGTGVRISYQHPAISAAQYITALHGALALRISIAALFVRRALACLACSSRRSYDRRSGRHRSAMRSLRTDWLE